MLHGAPCAERNLDPCLVVPAYVGVECCDEVVDARVQPVARVEQFVLQAAEEALASGVVWRACLARHRANQLRISDPGQPARPPVVSTTIGMHDWPVATGGD